jgi:hypothetical protein
MLGFVVSCKATIHARQQCYLPVLCKARSIKGPNQTASTSGQNEGKVYGQTVILRTLSWTGDVFAVSDFVVDTIKEITVKKLLLIYRPAFSTASS